MNNDNIKYRMRDYEYDKERPLFYAVNDHNLEILRREFKYLTAINLLSEVWDFYDRDGTIEQIDNFANEWEEINIKTPLAKHSTDFDGIDLSPYIKKINTANIEFHTAIVVNTKTNEILDSMTVTSRLLYAVDSSDVKKIYKFLYDKYSFNEVQFDVGVIFMHNHPGQVGATPSKVDLPNILKDIILLEQIGLHLFDYIVVSAFDMYSQRQKDLEYIEHGEYTKCMLGTPKKFLSGELKEDFLKQEDKLLNFNKLMPTFTFAYPNTYISIKEKKKS